MAPQKQSQVANAFASPHRRGFTLVELLVVMALMAVLATLTIAFFPSAASSARESRAAIQVQSWLNIAKQKALRDQAPRGLRLWVNPSAVAGITPIPNAVTDCQYLEQPDDFTGGSISTGASLSNINGTVDLTNGDTNPLYWSVQPGDYLEVMGTGLMHQIQSISGTSFTITPPRPYALAATMNYRIIRAPRPVGEETLKLPEGTVIDLATNSVVNPLPQVDPGYVDILFSPSGQVISRNVTTANIHLWVRAPINDPVQASDPFAGDPTIVSIFVRTGYVGAFPPARPPANPYILVR